jgi:hypothetical protein
MTPAISPIAINSSVMVAPGKPAGYQTGSGSIRLWGHFSGGAHQRGPTASRLPMSAKLRRFW